MSSSYFKSPDLRIIELDKLAKLHGKEMKNSEII
jgi:hypothetical protein